MKSIDYFENQLVEFRNHLTIKAVFFERELRRPFFSAKNLWNLWNSIFCDHTMCNYWRLILDLFWSILLSVWSLEKVVLVGKVVLHLRFGLSQDFRLCLVVFQVYKRCLGMLVWFLCDSRVIVWCSCIFWKCNVMNFVNLLK